MFTKQGAIIWNAACFALDHITQPNLFFCFFNVTVFTFACSIFATSCSLRWNCDVHGWHSGLGYTVSSFPALLDVVNWFYRRTSGRT